MSACRGGVAAWALAVTIVPAALVTAAAAVQWVVQCWVLRDVRVLLEGFEDLQEEVGGDFGLMLGQAAVHGR